MTRLSLSAVLAALLMSGAAAHGDEVKPAPKPPPQTKAAPDRAQRPKLSAEDEALVRDLALVENVDLLKDLDLFEGKEQEVGAKDPPQRPE